ncbi:MAG TPA: YfdX family protein [Pirellulales bacterium]|nr:YfdX family protein [Pirellulales bacterium]
MLCLMAGVAIAADAPRPDAQAKRKTEPSRIVSKVDMEPVGELSDEEAREVSFAAGRIVKHVIQARYAIRKKDNDQAATHVQQALQLIAIIDSVMPHFKVKTEIKAGDLTYSDEDDVAPNCVRFYDELEWRDILSPIAQAKKESEHGGQNNRSAASAEREVPAALAVTHADMVCSTAKLDVELARHMLTRAKEDLAEDKAAEADQALLALQSRAVLFEVEEIDLPLEEAADNLKLAEVEMQAGRIAEAKVALHAAIDQLKRYENLVGENRGAEVKALHEEISKLTAELEGGKLSEAEKRKHATRISDWWHRATKWFKGNVR